jgi:glycosyltransferase involved in cell wall biosynthesis
MRIQFAGDLAGTGFGTVTRDLGLALLAEGHDLRFISQNDTDADLEEPFKSRTFEVTSDLVDIEVASIVGTNSMALSAEGILKLIRGELWQDGWKPEAAILLGDFVNVRRLVMADEDTIAAFQAVPTYHYVPIEGVDLPPAWAMLWRILHPIAMSEFGADQIELVTGSRPPVIYHGVDTEQFRPVSAEHPLYLESSKQTIKLRSKAECKRFFGGDPKGRWILRTDRFMPRKRYGSFLRALAPVLAERPDVRLLMHCRSVDEGGHMYDLISKYPRPIAERMLISGFHDRFGGAPRDVLTALYNAADVYASCSAEGFGLTIAEALACGTPAVGMDYSAVPEVIGPGGLLAPVNRLDDNEYDHAWATVDEQAFGAKVAQLLDNELARRSFGRAAAAHIRASFQWTNAARQFGEVMETRMEAVA